MKVSLSSFPLIISGEAIANAGEDAYVARVLQNGSCYFGVFDGCGGLGGRRYLNFELKNHTSAWLGSRLAAYAFDTYFQNNALMMWETDLNARTISLQKHIAEILQRAASNCNQQSGLRGSLSRTFPTTVSLIAVECSEDQADAVASNRGSCYTNAVDVQFWWAGDSRGFILDENGLGQVTVDDIDTHKDDAFANLREDDRLTNIVNADVDFELHCRQMHFDQSASPCMFITATDGCFAYFSTPMEFEFLLLETLCRAKSPEEWKHLLFDRLKEIAGDDYTLMIGCIGFSNFQAMKKYYKFRLNQLEKDDITPIRYAQNNEKELQKIWETYKQQYYRWSKL